MTEQELELLKKNEFKYVEKDYSKITHYDAVFEKRMGVLLFQMIHKRDTVWIASASLNAVYFYSIEDHSLPTCIAKIRAYCKTELTAALEMLERLTIHMTESIKEENIEIEDVMKRLSEKLNLITEVNDEEDGESEAKRDLKRMLKNQIKE